MNHELLYNFLYNTKKFKEQFQRVLDRTPRERNAGKVNFWIHFFSSVIAIQNTQLNADSTHVTVEDIAFSIGDAFKSKSKPKTKTKILKLAFKVQDNEQDKVILRSISIGEDDNTYENIKYSKGDIQKITTLFWSRETKTSINLNTQSQALLLNIKTSHIHLETHNIKRGKKASSNFVKAKPLPQGTKLDNTLDLIAVPAPINDHDKIMFKQNVEKFFNQLIELYNTNAQGVLLNSELAYHGFIYGVLALNYKNKYAIDTYVEQSAGRGFLDLYFLLRKDAHGNNISNAVKIITEVKGDASNIMSVTYGMDQATLKSYAAVLGRNDGSYIIVSTDFGNIATKLQVTKQMDIKNVPKQDFISMLINARQVTLTKDNIKQALKYIYDSTRSDESLDRVILGELLSSNVEKNIFVINISDNQHISIFVFKNENQNAVILTIIERENLNPLTYDRAFLKDPSKRVIKENTVNKKVTIEEETRDAILHIQGELNIIAGKRIDITINPKGKVFESVKSTDFYCLDITVNDLSPNALQRQKSYISQFITRYNINSNIDIDHLIPSLQHLDLDNISSPPHDDDRDIAKEQEALNGLREELFKLKDFITLKRDESAYKTTEANFKSVLHGIFLHKKYHEESILVVPELSVGHGRADLVLVLASESELALELGLGDERNVPAKQQQLEKYIAYLKTITDAKEAKGVSLIFNQKATAAKDILVGKGFVGKVDHSTEEDSPVKQALDNPQPGLSGVQSEQKRLNPDDIHSDVSHHRKKLKFTACFSDSDRKKREASFLCKFSGEDIDKFSVKRTRDIDELQIDSKKFLEYLKDSNDQVKNSQLLELVKIRQIENSDNIIGNYNHLLDQIIQDGNYNSYDQNERIQDITHDLLKNGFPGRGANLKSTIINAASKIQLIRGIHGNIASCQTEGAERDCILSTLDLSYSFLSQPIESTIVKQGSKFGIKVSKSFSQTVPRILGYNTKFALKILGAKYGVKFLKGIAGGVTGIFDIVDIGLSAQALKECTDRAGTDNKCSDREIRDNIASITFSGVSFITGIVLTAASAGGPVTIGVALAFMISYGIYSGASAIVEYEEKYDTTDDENFRIFWHQFALQSPPEDVQHLAARTEAVNNIVKTAWQDLTSMPDNVVAYAGGLGKIRLQHFPKQCRTVLKYIEAAQGGGGQVYVDECSPAYTKPYLESSSAKIDMRWSSNDNNYGLSRVLPDHINGATMTCLPKATNAVYEKGGTIRSDSNAIYKCDNSFVIERDLRQNQGTKSIVFNSQLINSGRIIIGADGLSGIFLLNSHNIEINTFSHRNEFIFLHNKFLGTIGILRHGSINIFNTGQLSDRIVTFNIEENWSNIYTLKINIFINGEQIKLLHDIDDSIQIQYHARKHKQDVIKCESRGTESNSTNIFVDSGGGFNNQRQDIIKNCKKAIIWPYTKVEGNNSTYIFYIKTAGYEKQNSSSEINIIGKGTITFLDTALLKDCEDITYSEASNTISLRIKLGENIFYRLDIKNYLDKGSKIPNFSLIDKYSSNILLEIEQDTTIVSKFELYIEKDVHASDTNDISVVKRYYRKISDKKINYELFGSVKYKEKYYHFGSDGKDVITLDKHTQFALGGEGSDIYIVSNDMDMGTVIIDNGSRHKELDVLMVQSIDNVSLVSQGNNLNILIKKTNGHLVKIDNIIIRNYFAAHWYKHLLLVDQEGKVFIPFFTTNKDLTLVPFYSCDISNMFEISIGSKVVLDCDLNNIEYYRDNDNLMLFNKNTDNPIITIEQFFNDPVRLQIYQYTSKGKIKLLKNNALNYYIFEYFSSDIYIEDLKIEFKDAGYDLLFRSFLSSIRDNDDQPAINLIQKANNPKDYKEKIKELYNKIFKEYKLDFSKSFKITHNHQELENGMLIPVSSDQERLGVLIFKDIVPHKITVSRYGNDLIISGREEHHFSGNNVVIKNWFIDQNYTISTVEFDLGLEPIKIHKWNEDTNMIKGNDPLELLLNKIRLSEEINTARSIYLRDALSGDELYTLKCVTIVNNLNSIVKSYAALGFSSPEEQINFVKNCKFTESSLVQLKTFIGKIAIYLYHFELSNLVLPPPNMVHNQLALDAWYKLALRGYNYEEAFEIYNNISREFDSNKIIENINKVQNALRNTPNEEVFQRNRRDVDVDDEFITSGANSISSPVNELLNWFKNKYYFIFDQVKEPYINSSESTEGFLGGEQGSIFNNGLWNWGWNKLSNLSFKLLPEIDSATLDKSKSFNDFNKLIKQSNNHPSDTQIKKSNDITSQYDYDIPSGKYKNSIPPSAKDQKLDCVPYSWDSNNQAYVTDAITCISPSGQAKVFSNVNQETNLIQAKDYSIQEDIYKNCRPVEFFGRDSVHCEGKHTNMIYTPVFHSKLFDNLDVQIMLFRVGVHLVKKALDYLKPKQEYIERHIETDKETIDLWTKSIKKVKILLNDLQNLENLNQEDLKFINDTNYDLCEIRENIKNYIEKKIITNKEYEIINEKLEALIEELDETKNRYFIDVEEDCNQEISIEQLPHNSNGVLQHNTVYNGYYIDHNNSQEYYNNSYLLGLQLRNEESTSLF
ncbi:hypothetical protein [Candidatus Tisiphia endosymbiont of Metellina segmentata]|uniref:hypothetical protein n=1 Tax=Candidatus Tisiphia endosymbiont of Metellina segmentata TaxID=3066274 RepID=UPI00313DDF83